MKTGDKVFYDGKTWTVTSDPDSAGYVWISDTAYNGSYNIIRSVGDLTPVEQVSDTRLNKNCGWHTWKRYTGAVEVYDFCDHCDLKRQIDWKELGK